MTYKSIEEYPGWLNAPAYLESFLAQHTIRRVADIGGGANPLLDEAFVRRHGLDYAVLDVSAAELAKAPDWCRKIQVDIGARGERCDASIAEEPFDLVFMHMLLEHIRDVRQAHLNIHRLLRPGGLAIHFYPTPYSLPLLFNRWLPDRLSFLLLRLWQPWRDFNGNLGKFPAYYDLCGNPGPQLTRTLESLGYEVLEHSGYIGHFYYVGIPGLEQAERLARRLLLRLQWPITSCIVLALRRR